jgi:hypothetical protein
MTIDATKMRKMPEDSRVLVRTSTQAAWEGRTSSRTSEATVMMTELRKEEEYWTFGLVQIVTAFCRILAQSEGNVRGLCVISKGVLPELMRTMKKGNRNTMNRAAARASRPKSLEE